MRNYKLWSTDEGLVVVDLVATHGPSGIKMAAKQLNRTEESVRKYIYRELIPQGKIQKKILPVTTKELQIRKKVIEKHVKNNPGNIKKALELAALELHKSPNTVKLWYYGKNSTLNRTYLSPCFAIVGKSFATNSKIFKSKRINKTSLLSKINYLISKLWK